MRKLLLVIDMQRDFVDGALGTAEAVKIVPNVVRKIKTYSRKDVIGHPGHPWRALSPNPGGAETAYRSLCAGDTGMGAGTRGS